MKNIKNSLMTIVLLTIGCSQPNNSNNDYQLMVVGSKDGIPVYRTADTQESSICGWLNEGDVVSVFKGDPNQYGMKKIKLNTETSCGPEAFVQMGFLLSPSQSGDGVGISESKLQIIRNFKSAVPQFQTSCVERNRNNKIIVSFVGDVLLHGALQKQAYSYADGFETLWGQLNPVFKNADLAYANLEGPAARGVNCRGQITQKDGLWVEAECRDQASSIYTSYPMFNYHPRVTDDLKSSGFDIVSTANNHSLDRYSNGVDLTIDALNQSGLSFMGTRKKHSDAGFYTVTRVRSQGGAVFNIAWVACTFSANGFVDRQNQVLSCYKYNSKGQPVYSQTNPLVLETVQSLANTNGIDGVIVTPHWGPTEYTHSVHPSQTRLAYELAEAGAVAVIGAHPHVLQPWEVIQTSNGIETFVHYSLGNFVSGQNHIPRRASMVLLVGFQKDRSGQMKVDGVRFIPTYMKRGGSKYALELETLDRGQRMSNEGLASLNNILSLYPEELRLDSSSSLTTCQ